MQGMPVELHYCCFLYGKGSHEQDQIVHRLVASFQSSLSRVNVSYAAYIVPEKACYYHKPVLGYTRGACKTTSKRCSVVGPLDVSIVMV